ncbi:MAG TPA: thioesterase family protein [Thermoanaerobaculia bacterium]|nr:thioesterase family protein [Thermoanaerobaculia bacterium]
MNLSPPLHEHLTRRRVEFADTDMEGIIHFSRFFIFMETAEHQFLNALGSSVASRHNGKRLGWPRTAVGCEFLRPVRFEDELGIRLLVLRKGARAITYGCEFRLVPGVVSTTPRTSYDVGAADGARDELVARGQSTSVCCSMEEEGGLRSIEIPPGLAERIAEIGAEEKARWRSPIRPL